MHIDLTDNRYIIIKYDTECFVTKATHLSFITSLIITVSALSFQQANIYNMRIITLNYGCIGPYSHGYNQLPYSQFVAAVLGAMSGCRFLLGSPFHSPSVEVRSLLFYIFSMKIVTDVSLTLTCVYS